MAAQDGRGVIARLTGKDLVGSVGANTYGRSAPSAISA
jgi:hypothetical protein